MNVRTQSIQDINGPQVQYAKFPRVSLSRNGRAYQKMTKRTNKRSRTEEVNQEPDTGIKFPLLFLDICKLIDEGHKLRYLYKACFD